ncbi:baeRF11 domain-containing protein [Pseudochelatococcus sp. B33]
MVYVDIPSLAEIKALSELRADAVVSIYLPTTPVTQDIEASRIALGNLVKAAVGQLGESGFDKRRLAALQEQLDDLRADDAFWIYQANSLAIVATPDQLRTYRLANKLTEILEVSDRVHLKPLLRAVTFPHTAYVLSLSENNVRLIELSADLPAREVSVSNMPSDAASAVGRKTVNDSTIDQRGHSPGGQKTFLTQYSRKVDAALRPLLVGRSVPLILAATEPLASIYRSVASYPHLLAQGISASTDRWTLPEFTDAARPILDAHYAAQIDDLKALFAVRAGERRATTDVADTARAATFGQVDTLFADIDEIVHGTVDEATGEVHFGEEGPDTYGIVDEIAVRVLNSGGRVLAVRRADIPGEGSLAAILRFPI